METFYKKLKLIAIAFLMLVSSTVWAAFIKNMPQTFTQPNGQVINIFASGDEYYNWLHDADNFTIVKDKVTGYYVYAVKVNGRVAASTYVVGAVNPKSVGLTSKTLDDEAYIQEKVAQKKSAKSSYKTRYKTAAPSASASVRPAVGLYNNIVVYIEFADQNGSSLTKSEAEGKFNGTGIVSVKDYYNEVSGGQLNVTSSFYPVSTGAYPVYYKDSHPRSYYCKETPDGYGENGTADREHTLLKNAIDAISSQVPTSLNIDGNNDGFVDNVTFVFNGNTEGWAELLWPHRWALFSQNAYIGTKQVYDYNTVFTSALGVGVISHEMFHSFGAPDLYQYSSWSSITPVGQWDVMAGTDWGLPQHMTVYLKARYGTWTTIQELTNPGTYTLQPVATSPFSAYKIKLPNSSQNEYIVLEYRKKTGKYEPATYGADGLLVYRVFESGNNAGGPQHEVYVYRKDGTLTLDGDLSNATFHQDRSLTSFNDNTNPSPFLSNGQAGGILASLGISNINVTATAVTFNFGGTGSSCNAPAWVSTAVYVKDDQVSYNGNKYKAKWWNQNEIPGANQWGAWELVGPCTTNFLPVVNITSPANNANINIGTAITLTASASDVDGTISKVEFLNSANVVVYADNTPPFEYAVGTPPNGTYTYKAIAYDNQNAASAPSTVTFSVVTPIVKPIVTITSPTQDQVFYQYPSEGVKINVTVNVNSQTPVDSVQYIIVDVVCNGPGCANVRRFTSKTAPYSLSFDPVYSTNAYTEIHAMAFSNGINSDAATKVIHVKPLPELTIVTPAENSSVPKNTTQVPFDVTVNSNNLYIDSVVYDVTDVLVQGQVATYNYRKFKVLHPYDLVLPVISGYSYTIVNVLAFGDGGKFSKLKTARIYYNAAPVITVTAPLPVNGINPKYLVGGSMTVSANVTDSDGSITKVEFSQGNNPTIVTDVTAPYSATFTNLPAPAPDGSYWFTIKAYDNTGATTTQIVSVFRNRVPSVSITSPINNASITAGSNVTINTLVYDPDFTSGKVEFFNGTTKLGEATSAPFSFTISNIAGGSYAISAKVTDDMGETGVSSVVNFTVPSGGCSAVQYVENGGYVAGSKVKNNGTQYECKGYPYTAWCNGAAWAYAPGTGTYWADAWIQIGACREGAFIAIDANVLTMYPNPASDRVSMTYEAEGTGEVKVIVVNDMGETVMVNSVNVNAGENLLDVNLSELHSGIYHLRIEDSGKVITKKLSVVK